MFKILSDTFTSATFWQLATLAATVAGWWAAYYYGVRAQRRVFLDQLLSESRLEIVQALRNYRDALSGLGASLLVLQISAPRFRDEGEWRTLAGMFGKNAYNPNLANWAPTMEQYEILFPVGFQKVGTPVFQNLSPRGLLSGSQV